MAGIFDRLKERFTQNAAGTTDLSSLSEDQQKLLRRQYIGRLGSSLAQTGDFGAGMEAQAKDAQARQAQMLEQQQRAEVANIWGNGSPLNDAQRQLPGVSAPPPPTLSQGAAPQGAAPQGAAPQGAAPQQRAAALNDASQKRAYYENVARQLAAAGRGKEAEFALDMAKQFAARETFFAPTSGIVNGEERMFQASDAGGMQILDAAPLATNTTRTARQLGADPEALRTHLAIQNAGANRSTIVNEAEQYVSPFMRALGTEDAKRFTAAGSEATLAGQTLNSLGQLKTTLSDVRTGRIPGMIATAGQFAGTEEGSKAQAAQAMVQDQVVSAMALLKGPATDQDAARIEAMIPNIFMDPRAAQEVFAYLERKAREKQMVFDEMLQHVNTPGNNGLLGFQSSFSRLPEQVAPQASTGGTNRFDRAGVRR